MTRRKKLIEVNGRIAGTETITATRNEILTSPNKPEESILAIVERLDDNAHRVHSVRRLFRKDPGFGVTDVNESLPELLAGAQESS